MKKKCFLLSLALCCIISPIFSQKGKSDIEKIQQIDTFVANGKTYSILSDFDTRKNAIYITLQTNKDGEHAMSKFSVYQINQLIKRFDKAEITYKEWSFRAKEASVKQFSKRISRIRDQHIFFTEKQTWYHEKGVNVWLRFFVDDNGECFFIMETDYMSTDEVVSKNLSTGWGYSFAWGGGWGGGTTKTEIQRYNSGAHLTFSSTDEIEQFLEKLQKAVEWSKKSKEANRLFR